MSLLWAVLGAARSLVRTRREFALENLALRQQVAVLIRTSRGRRLRLGVLDRAFLGHALGAVGQLERCPGDRRARDSCPLAPEGVQALLKT